MFSLRVLGVADLRGADGTAVDGLLAQPSRFALLAYVAVGGGAMVRRDELLAVFWPELDESRARNALSQALHVLRRALGAEAIVSRGVEVAIDTNYIRCDAAEVERLAATGDAEAAVAAYGGELLPAFNLNGVPEFERWLDVERVRLRAIAAGAAWQASDEARGRGDLANAVRHARWAVDVESDERALRRLMELLEASGDRAAALRAYQDFSRRVWSDLDLEPSAETRAIVDRLADRDERTVASVPPDVASVAPYGIHVPVPEFASGDSRPTTRRRTRVLAVAGVVCLVLAFGIAWAIARSRASHRQGDVVRIAVMPFSIFATPDLAYLSGGMMDVLSLDLDGVGPVRTIDPHAVASFVAHADTTDRVAMGTAAARQLSADRFVLGTVVVTGARRHVSASLYDLNGRVITTGAVDVESASDVLTATDRIARELLAHELPSPAEGLSRLAALTSSSISALRHYLEGERDYRDGHFDRAAEAFGAAVDEDSAFALGNYRLAASLDWGIHHWKGKTQYEYLARALRHMDRLGPRDQQDIRALNEFWLGSPKEAAVLYRSVLSERPDDVEAWEGLGEVDFHRLVYDGIPIAGSREPFEHVLALDPANVNAMVHLSRLAALRHDDAAVDSFARHALALAPTHDAATEMSTLAGLASSRADIRAHAFDALRAAGEGDAQRWDPLWLAAWRVATYREDPAAGLAIAGILADPRRTAASRLLGAVVAAQMSAGLGRWEEVSQHLDAAARIDSVYASGVRANLLLRGPFALTPARVARLDQHPGPIDLTSEVPVLRSTPMPGALTRASLAFASNDSMKLHAAERELESVTGDPIDVAHFKFIATIFRARELWRAGSPKEALTLLETHWLVPIDASGAQYARGWERMTRADLLHALGRDREALTWYQSIPEDLGMGIMYAAPAHLGAAHAYDVLGDSAAAAREYARVVEIWGTATDELKPIVDEARRRAQRR